MIVSSGTYCHVYCPSARAVALWLWGRDVRQYTVYDGECPYHFAMGDIGHIERILRLYPAKSMRAVLPVTVAEGLTIKDNKGRVVCVIGGQV